MMTCEQARELLLSVLDDEASAEEKTAVEAHLAGCAACQRERDEMERTRRVIGGVIASGALGGDFAKETADKAAPPQGMDPQRGNPQRGNPQGGNPWEWSARLTVIKWVAAAVVLLALAAYFPMKIHQGMTRPVSMANVETRVFTQQAFLAGTRASVRVVTRDWKKETPVAGAHVELRLLAIDRPDLKLQSPEKVNKVLATGTTDGEGTLSQDFVLPDLAEGEYAIQVDTTARDKSTRIAYPIQLRRATAIYLTTDKPLYQPGQVIYVRALAVKKSDLKPIGVSKITLEIEDPKGNKILKAPGQTSQYGIADTTLLLGDEINLGAYTVRATLETGGKTETTEKKVAVDRYSLPKFRITAKADKDYYHPMDKVKLHVQADYFFGKPVADAAIEVVGTTLKAGPHEFFRGSAKTDATGACDFPEVELPAYFVGQPLVQGKGLAQFEVKLTDPGKQVESTRVATTVSEGDLQVTAFPDGGSLVPSLANTVWVVANYPDGSPAKARVEVTLSTGVKEQVETDEMGLGTFEMESGPGAASVKASLVGKDARGNTGKADVDLAQRGGDQGLRVLLDKATYKVGESMRVTVRSTTKDTDAYVDVLRNGQTALTRTVRIRGGKGELDVELPNDLFGMVEVSAYEVKKSLNIVRDTRKAFVTPAEDLKLDIALDKETYRPGQEASLDVRVTDAEGHPVLAALGLWVIDPAVLARTEIAPGLEKVFFLLEKELLKPKVEIRCMSAEKVLTDVTYRERDRAAKALFAASETLEQHPLRLSSREEEIKKKLEEDAQAMAKAAKEYVKQERERLHEERIVEDWKHVMETYQKAWNEGKLHPEMHQMEAAYDRIWTAIQAYWKLGRPRLDETLDGLVKAGVLTEAQMADPWGHRYHCVTSFCGCNANHYPHELRLVSAGTDGVFGTGDDIEMGPNHNVTRGYPATDVQDLVKMGLLKAEEATDPWGTPYHASLYPNTAPQGWASAGPDRKMAEGDDDDIYLQGDHIAGKFLQESSVDRFVDLGLCLPDNLIDPWGTKYVKIVPYGGWEYGVALQSAGPNGVPGDADDLAAIGFSDDSARAAFQATNGVDLPGVQGRPEGVVDGTAFAGTGQMMTITGQRRGRFVRRLGDFDTNGLYVYRVYGTTATPTNADRGFNHFSASQGRPGVAIDLPEADRVVFNGSTSYDDGANVLYFAGSVASQTPGDPDWTTAVNYTTGPDLPTAEPVEFPTSELWGQVKDRQPRGLGSTERHDDRPVARLREYFPETLLAVPEVVTDANGHARLTVHLADTITRWEASAFANSLDGRMGSTERAIPVFQEFFLDAGLPPYLTQNDTVTIPVSVMNYKKTPQDVKVKLTPADWYEVVDGGYESTVRVEAEKVSGVQFTLRAKRVGTFALRIDAASPTLADAVQRRIEVIPDGREVAWSASDRLEGKKSHTFTVPEDAIDGASTLLVRVCPGIFAQVVEGMESMLQLPCG